MHDTIVVMKDGREFCAPLWEWRPKEGWFTLVLSEAELPNPEGKFFLAEVASAVTVGTRGGLLRVGDVDLLARAEKEIKDGG